MAIQVGKLRKFVPKGQTNEVGFFKTINNFHYDSLKDLFDKIDKDIPKFVSEEENYNLFYTVAHHLKGSRTKSSWQAQDIIPFDLDGIDLEKIDEYPPLLARVCGFDLDKCAIVYTGNGCHVLVQVPMWKDENYINHARLAYKNLYKEIKAACDEAGLPLDVDTTAWDYARILRVPFSRNEKVKEIDGELKKIVKQSVLIQNKLETQQWSLPAPEQVKESHSLKVGSFPMADSKEILKECDFFKWLQEHPDEVHEPHAYAMLSITGHFNDEQTVSKRLWESFSSPSINSKNLDEFTEQATTASGPRTCTGIESIWGKCKQCPHYQKVTSPIMLKGEDFIGTEHMGFTTLSISGKSKIRHYDDLVKAFKRDHHYKNVAEVGDFYVFNETHYEKYHSTQVKKYAQDKFQKPIKESERVEYLKAVEASDFTPIKWLEQKPEGLINLQNGVLNIKANTLMDHNPEYNFTNCLPFDYNPSAKCPNWEKFIDDVTLGRKDLQDILHEYMGYCIYGGEYLYHKALVLSGGGKNGKSTFIEVLTALLGEKSISTVPLTSLSKDVFAMADMQGSLANISEEEPPSCFKETGVFKNLTGNNTVRAQKKFKDPFKMRSRSKIVITYNELPFIGDTTTGMRRRLLIIPFDLNLEAHPEKVNKNIKFDLEKELSGIFNHALEGWKRLEKQEGFTKSAIVDNAVKDVVESSNSFYIWWDENVEHGEDFKVSAQDLYLDYINFMEETKESNRKGRAKFHQELKNCNQQKVTIRQSGKTFKGYKGIKLRKEVSETKF